LSASTSTPTTELLWFHPPGVCNQQRPIIRHQFLLQLDCTVGIDVFGVVRNERLRNGLADRVHLRRVSTAFYAHTNVDVGESFFAGNEDGLVDFEAEDFGLYESDG
jgi:hypothetical protein